MLLKQAFPKASLTRAGPTPSEPTPSLCALKQGRKKPLGTDYYVPQGYSTFLAFVRERLEGPGSEGKGCLHPNPPTKLQVVPPRLGSPREKYKILSNLCGDSPESCKLSPGSLLGGGAWKRPWSGLPWGGSVRCLSSRQYPFLASPQTVRQRVG